jgi:hypothetical protein
VFENGAKENIWTKEVEVRGERKELQYDKLCGYFCLSDFTGVISVGG